MSVQGYVEVTAAQLAHLGTLVSGEVSVNATVLAAHGRDESGATEIPPSAVVFAHSTDEVAAVLAYCNEQRIPVVPFGAGTSIEGHVLAVHGGISLDVSQMDRILEVKPDDMTVRVQAGVHRVALNERLGREGLFFSVDPGADATLGGMASTGAAGTTTVRYGSMRDNVLGLTAVLADGRVIRTGRESRKQSAGYDLTRLIVGSEGTLAVVTEITLKVYGIPERITAARAQFPSLRAGVQAATDIVRLGLPVARCEFLSADAVRCVNAYSNSALAEAATLLFEFHGTNGSVADTADAVQEVVAAHDGFAFEWAQDEAERVRIWQARHHAYWAIVAAHPGLKALTTDAAVPLSKLADIVDATNELLAASGFGYAIVGHVADGNFHASIMCDPDQPGTLDRVRNLTKQVSRMAIAVEGTCTGEHGIGLGKIDSLAEEVGEDALDTMRAIKHALDPNWILNPGKVFRA